MSDREKLERTLEFHLKAHGVKGWVKEHRFVEGRRFRFDFAWPEEKLAVEVDGGIWSEGAHARGTGIERDHEKANLAILNGWSVLRFGPNAVKSGEAVRVIEQALAFIRKEGV